MKKPNKPSWWVDIAESEEADWKNISNILERFPTESLIVDNLRVLKSTAKKYADVQLPESEAYYEDLAQVILRQVVEGDEDEWEEAQKKTWRASSSLSKR